jgi:hypothetical protein
MFDEVDPGGVKAIEADWSRRAPPNLSAASVACGIRTSSTWMTTSGLAIVDILQTRLAAQSPALSRGVPGP